MKRERNNLMKRSLEKWGRAPIILRVLVEHPFSRRARALTIQRGTGTHCSKTNKQGASEQLQSEHERNKFMKCSLEKMGARAPIIFGGLDEHPFLRRREHSPVREHLFREQMNEHI
jgi:hypothetical protein